jgi:type II secretion system protein J
LKANAPHRDGFTLIEILLALAIFTIIGLATVRHIQQLQNTKTAAFQELDEYDNMRAALSLVRYDLSQSFHIRYEDLGATAKQAVEANTPVPHTLFDGRKKELVFTSLSHRVYYSGLRESEQTEISYFLQPKKGAQYPSLMKRESEIIDADLYSGGKIYTLLDNVASLELFYWDEKAAKWVDDWNSDNGQYRDRFPMAVKMRISVVSNGRPLKIDSEFKLAFPNNDRTLINLQ